MAAYQQVGSFEVVDEHGKLQRNGGNVASYFCTPDGRVIDALTGPVGADELLDEAHWVVSAYQNATSQRSGDVAAILAEEHREAPVAAGHTSKGRAIHQLLARRSLPPVSAVYQEIFERILGQKVSLPGDGIDQVAEAVADANRRKLPVLFILHKEANNEQALARWDDLVAGKGGADRLARLADSYLTIAMPLKFLPAASQRLGTRPYAAPDNASPLFVVARSDGSQLKAVTGWQRMDELTRALALGLVQEAKEQSRTTEQLARLLPLVQPVDSCLGAEVRKLQSPPKGNKRSPPRPARGAKVAAIEHPTPTRSASEGVHAGSLPLTAVRNSAIIEPRSNGINQPETCNHALA